MRPDVQLLQERNNQSLENETSETVLKATTGAEPEKYVRSLRNATHDSNKHLHHSHVCEEWHLKIPTLFSDGHGGPDECNVPGNNLSLRKWIEYVIRPEEL